MPRFSDSPDLRLRVTTRTKALLGELAIQEGKPIHSVVDEVIELDRRDKFLVILPRRARSL